MFDVSSGIFPTNFDNTVILLFFLLTSALQHLFFLTTDKPLPVGCDPTRSYSDGNMVHMVHLYTFTLLRVRLRLLTRVIAVFRTARLLPRLHYQGTTVVTSMTSVTRF